ncbi:MAG: YHS domain-containing (seleno)protein [Pseudomonadota bacterium]
MTRIGTALVVLVVSFAAGCTALNTPVFTTDDGAIRGYDPVAYHVAGEPQKGSAGHQSTYNGETWFFASAENKSLFDADPERYAPAYGGYCAYGMSKGYVVSTVPEAWHIEDGQLYLNYSLGVRKTFLKDAPGNIARADVNWEKKLSDREFE